MSSKSKKIAKVIDGLRAWNLSSSFSSKGFVEVEENQKPEHFQFGKVSRHGFPYEPTCIAFDPVQYLLAIGTKNGSIKIFGRPGVDCYFRQPSQMTIVQLIFLINQGAIISICQDDSVYLWSYRQKTPEIVHTLKFKRERLSCGFLAFQSNWLIIGSEQGNVHFVNVQKFILSGYIINWNKAIDLSQTSHPGAVVHLAENPQDPNKLLIGFSTGLVVIWDIKLKAAEARFKSKDNHLLYGLSWNHDGKQFMSAYSNGFLATWNAKQPQRATSMLQPHSRDIGDEKSRYEAIRKVQWLSCKSNESITVFSGGGLHVSPNGGLPSITVMRGKRRSVLQMEYPIVDFVCLCETPFDSEPNEPYAVAVLLQQDLVVIDLLSVNYLSFENPYSFDLHSSPITACRYVSDCPCELIPALYSVGNKRSSNTADVYSQREWPIKGGEEGTSCCSYSEVMITGHADGSVRFWDMSSMNMAPLYKIHTARFLQTASNRDSVRLYNLDHELTGSEGTSSDLTNRDSSQAPDVSSSVTQSGEKVANQVEQQINGHVIPLSNEDYPHAIYHIFICPESRKLVSVGCTHLIVMNFNKNFLSCDIPVLDISVNYDMLDDSSLTDISTAKQNSSSNGGNNSPAGPSDSNSLHHQGSVASDQSAPNEKTLNVFMPVRSQPKRWSPGYQPELVCRLGTYNVHVPAQITSVALNSAFGLLAFGNDCGLAVVDIVQKTCLLSTGTPDLYGSLDPFSRQNKPLKKDDLKSPCREQTYGRHSCKTPVKSNAGHKHSTRGNPPPRPSNPPPPRPPNLNTNFNKGDDGSGSNASSCPETPEILVDNNWEIIDKSQEGILSASDPYEVEDKGTLKRAVSPSRLNREDSPSMDSSASTVSINEDLNTLEIVEEATEALTAIENSLNDEIHKHEEAPIVDVIMTSDPPSEDSDTQLPKISRKNQKSLMDRMRLSFISKKDQNQPNDQQDSSNLSPMSTTSQSSFGNTNSPQHSASTYSHESDSRDGSFKKPNPIDRLKRSFTSDRHQSGPGKESHEKTAPGNYQSSKQTTSANQPIGPAVMNMEIVDLTGDNVVRTKLPVLSSKMLTVSSLADKQDQNQMASKSCSSSTSSLEHLNCEAIRCVNFVESFAKKGDGTPSPTLWIGTSLGSVLVISILMPNSRTSHPVIVSPSGTMFRLNGDIVCIEFLDHTGNLLESKSEKWETRQRPTGPVTSTNPTEPVNLTPGEEMTEKTSTDSSHTKPHKSGLSTNSSSASDLLAHSDSSVSDKNNPPIPETQFAVLCSDKDARVVTLPSQHCPYKMKLSESNHVVRAQVVKIRGSLPVLACLLNTSHVLLYSLPSLRQLLDVDVPISLNEDIAKTLSFGHMANLVYFPTPSEIEKVTIISELCHMLDEMHGEIFVSKEMPQLPKKTIFQSLFGGSQPNTIDRDELFGEANAGKPSLATATHVGNPKMERVQGQAGGAMSAISQAKQAALERGERLGRLDDQAAEMMEQAKLYSRNAAALANKYEKKDKRWGLPF